MALSAGRGAGAQGDPITGTVLLPDGQPVGGARVRIQARDEFGFSGPAGAFLLNSAPEGPVKVIAALEGYRIGYSVASPGSGPLTIRMKSLPAADNPKYMWESPGSCAQCHALLHQDWSSSPHAQAATDPVVLALYRGTKLDGSPSAGFGYRKSHPASYGDCAFCHTPGYAAHSEDPFDDLEPHHDLERALSDGTPAERSGVFCDFCHKVRSAAPDGHPPRLGQNFTLLRPPQFDPLMFGPFDDVTFIGMGASYSPLFSEKSDLCGLCHWDINRNGVTVQSTFPEWLGSSYPAQGKLCQDCHLSPDGETNIFCLWEPVIRNPATIHSHRFAGADAEHLARAVTLDVQAERREESGAGEVRVEVQVTNSGAGHAVPTGVTMRQALLQVEARRSSGAPLGLIEGPRLPAWAGEGGAPALGYLAGQPGRGYARITTDGKSERVFDSEATGIVSDTRIAPLATDRSTYRFDLAGYRGTVEVRARVIYRRWWKDLEDERGFPSGDRPMVERVATLPGGPVEFLRGDSDGSRVLDITDAVVILGHLFTGEPVDLLCPDAADADDTGILDLSDAITVLNYLFTGGPEPPEPFPASGTDPTGDNLDC